MPSYSEVMSVGLVGTYLPRRCGIATFTSDIYRSIKTEYPDRSVLLVPVNDREGGYAYPPEVAFEITEQDISSYRRAADFLQVRDLDVISVQHEFGIYGGTAGGHVLALIKQCDLPVVTTLHTVLMQPSSDQRRVMDELAKLSSRMVVMTGRGKQILKDIYGVPDEKVTIIPHGIPDMPFVDPNFYKDEFGVEGKSVILTFGLLSPNKGIEYMLNALPDIVRKHPNVVYIVLGATHPNVLNEQGDSYRVGLERLARRNGVEKHVIFYNRFVELSELKKFIGAADIYVTPYLSEAQIVSGTLAYTFGAGKVIVSTPYWHAQDLIEEGTGVLVPFRDSAAMAAAINDLLDDETRRHAMRKAAYKMSREAVWSNVAHLYMKCFQEARQVHCRQRQGVFHVRTLDQEPGDLPELKLTHLVRLTDGTGVIQHATHTVPNLAEGYCTDDNARALVLTVMLESLEIEPETVNRLSSIYLAFILYAFDQELGWFRNFMGYDRKWLEQKGSDDCFGRAVWSLGCCIGRSGNPDLSISAGQLFQKALAKLSELKSPRAWAHSLIGIHEYLRRFSGDRAADQARQALTERLARAFEDHAGDGWLWFENSLTYTNAKLPHACILSGRWTNRGDVLEIGLKSLRWLVDLQDSGKGCFRPVGTHGFCKRGERPAQFDQQPIESQSTMSACLEAYRVTGDEYWYDKAMQVFEWFLGRNDLGLELYDSKSGGCCDGLQLDRVNQNQGAESTLAFMLALAEMQTTADERSLFEKAVSR